MSNIKEVHIDAYVPFDWMTHLTPEEAWVFAARLLAPTGLKFSYPKRQGSNSYGIPNSRGGVTTMYHLHIGGQEGISERGLVIMADAIRRLYHPDDVPEGSVAEPVCEYRDIQFGTGPWWTIRTGPEQDAAEARAHAQVEEMVKGKHWKVTKHGNGVETAVLVPDEE